MSKVTDQLLASANAAGAGERGLALELSRALRERHYNTAGELLGTGVFTQFHAELEAEFDALDELLRGISAVGELTPRTSDQVASFGERLNSRIVTAAFAAHDLPAVHVDSRTCIITDSTHTKAVPLLPHIESRLNELVAPLLAKEKVPVMGGFIGSTLNSVTTTLGRGGSDFTAAIVGGGLGANALFDHRALGGPRASASKRAAFATSASMKRLNSPTSAPRFCTRQPCCPQSKKTSRCWC